MTHKTFFLLALALGLVLVLAGCDEQTPVVPQVFELDAAESIERDVAGAESLESFDESGIGQHAFGFGGVKVMTWNIYVGTDIDKVLGAQDPSQIPVLAAEAFQLLLATNFPERADAIAKQVKRYRPHLIGLQEVSTIRIQSPGDAAFGGTTPAEDVLFDYLQIMLDALEAAGLHYKVAGVVQNTDAEVPMIVSVDPLQFDDIRLTDFDVVLARPDVQISNVVEANYQTRLPFPALGFDVVRGYVAVDAKVRHKRYRFVNTHLEPASSGQEIQLGQAQELIDALNRDRLPVILVGDLNTRPPSDATYSFFLAEGFADTWPLNRHEDENNPDGFTSNHDLDLRNEVVDLHQRIDFIMARTGKQDIGVLATVIGDELEDRTTSGLWPSDHAGVVAKLWIPRIRHFADR